MNFSDTLKTHQLSSLQFFDLLIGKQNNVYCLLDSDIKWSVFLYALLHKNPFKQRYKRVSVNILTSRFLYSVGISMSTNCAPSLTDIFLYFWSRIYSKTLRKKREITRCGIQLIIQVYRRRIINQQLLIYVRACSTSEQIKRRKLLTNKLRKQDYQKSRLKYNIPLGRMLSDVFLTSC